MNNTGIQPNLKDLSTSLLNTTINQAEIESTINEIHSIFKENTHITGSENKMEYLAAVPTAKGKALGLNHAAQCLLDYKRTIKFLRGMVTAIQDHQRINPGKTINIFYAGCGPYAPFVTMVAPLFNADEIQFSILEINKSSLESAQELISSLGFSAYLKESFLADAVTFKVPEPEKYHIVFSETLDALLYRECYVPILFNLLPQFKEDITLIPENVSIYVKYLNYTKHQDNSISDYNEYDQGEIVNVRQAIANNTTNEKMPKSLPPKSFDLNADVDYISILLDTIVHIYKDIRLERAESSLTLPLELKLPQPHNYNSIKFTYHMEPEIELKYEAL